MELELDDSRGEREKGGGFAAPHPMKYHSSPRKKGEVADCPSLGRGGEDRHSFSIPSN